MDCSRAWEKAVQDEAKHSRIQDLEDMMIAHMSPVDIPDLLSAFPVPETSPKPRSNNHSAKTKKARAKNKRARKARRRNRK